MEKNRTRANGKRIFGLIKAEWKRNFVEEKRKYSLPALVGALEFFWLLYRAYLTKNLTGDLKIPGFFDNIGNLFSGNASQIPDPFWIFVMMAFVYTISVHFSDKNRSYEYQILLRLGNRRKWWYLTCSWSILNAILFYGILCLENGVFALVTKSGWYLGKKEEGIYQWMLPIETLNRQETYIVCMILPIAGLICIGLVQTFLHLYFSDKIGMIFMMGWLILSCFQKNLAMIGNWIMLSRNSLMVSNGFQFENILLLELLVSLGVIWGGGKISEKKLDDIERK